MVVTDLLRALRPAMPSDSETRTETTRHCQHLAGLKKFAQLAEDLMDGVVVVAEYLKRHGLTSYARDASHRGFDWRARVGIIDYGNVVYKSVLRGFALERPLIHDAMTLVARGQMPTLAIGYADTDDSLPNQGDVIEILMGVTRGYDFCEIRQEYTSERWHQLFLDLLGLCRSVQYLRCLLHGGQRKGSPGTRARKIIKGNVPDTTVFLANAALALRGSL